MYVQKNCHTKDEDAYQHFVDTPEVLEAIKTGLIQASETEQWDFRIQSQQLREASTSLIQLRAHPMRFSKFKREAIEKILTEKRTEIKTGRMPTVMLSVDKRLPVLPDLYPSPVFWYSHSGYLQIDIDHLSPFLLEEYSHMLRKCRHIVATFISPSGDGVKGIFYFDKYALLQVGASAALKKPKFPTGSFAPYEKIQELHAVAFQSAINCLKATVDQGLAVEIDTKVAPLKQKMILPHDPKICIMRSECEPFREFTSFLPRSAGGIL